MSPDMARIVHGPRIMRLLTDAGSPLVEIEPLRFFPVMQLDRRWPQRIARKAR